MPAAQFNFDVNPGQTSSGRPLVSQGAAASIGEGYAAFGETTRHIARMVNKALDEHVEKQKRIEMQADDAAFQSFLTLKLTETKALAARTSDPEEVKRLYNQYEKDVGEYIRGGNERGAPNIRWKDHQGLLEQSLPAFSMQAETGRKSRLLEISTQESVSKADNSITEGIRTGNYDLIRSSVETRMAALGKGPEETKAMLLEKLKAADMGRANNAIGNIEQMDPEAAMAALTQFEMDLKSFENLNDADRGALKRSARGALEFSKSNFERAEEDRQAVSNGAVLKFAQENGRMPSPGERMQMNLTPETAKALDSGQLERISPALEGVAALSLKQEIDAYDKTKDPTGAQSLALMSRVYSFEDAGTKKWLTDKLDDALSDDPTKGVDALVKAQIEDALIAASFKDTDKNKALQRELKIELATYEQWVAEKNPTLDERLKYAGTGRFADLAKTKDRDKFRARLVQSYSNPETSRISNVRKAVQSQYGSSGRPVRKVIGVKRDAWGNIMARQYDDGTIEGVR